MRFIDVRFFHVLYLLLFAAFALNAPVASANTGTVTIECTKVTFAYVGFPNKPNNTITETVIVGGVTQTVGFSFNGTSGTSTVPIAIPAAGTTLVRARANWATNGVTGSIGKSQYLSGAACNPCTPGTPNPAGAHATGDSFGTSVSVLGVVNVPKRPAVSSSQTGVGDSHQDDVLTTITVPSLANLGILSVGSTGSVTADPAQADDSGFSEVSNVNLLLGSIQAGVVRASTEAIARGDSSAFNDNGSTFQNLVINGVQYNNVAPNTKINLPFIPGLINLGSYVTLRERIASTTSPAPGVLSGGTYAADITVNMIHVVLVDLLGRPTSEIVVAHSKSHADFPQTKICSAAAGNSVSGHAFVGSGFIEGLLDPPLVMGLSEIPSTGGSQNQAVGAGMLPGVGGNPSLLLSGGTSSSTGTVGATSSTSSSTASVTNANLMNGLVTATVLKTQSNSTASAGSRSSDATGTQLLNITIAGNPIGNDPAPNTKYELPGLGYLVLNEQIPDAPASGHTGLTVRAIHLVSTAPSPFPAAEMVLGESHSDATFK